MIQRIQSIYLFISVILTGLMIFFPTLIIDHNSIEYQLQFKGLMEITENNTKLIETTVFLSILTAIIPLISLIAINLYKRRILQIRLSIFNIVLMLGYYALFFFTRYILLETYTGTSTFGWVIIMPFISAILTFLAVRAIGKDEVLVRSYDRLR